MFPGPRAAHIVAGLLSLLVILGGSWSSADAAELPRLRGGGRFQIVGEDSLGYAQYRSLPAKQQLRRRKLARGWVRRSREFRNQGQTVGEADSRTQWLQRAVDAAATAVGLCPYLPQGWLAYARALTDLGWHDQAEVCLEHAEKTLPYDPGQKAQRQLQAELHRTRAVVAYNLGQVGRSHEEAVKALEIEADDEMRLLDARALIDLDELDAARERLDVFDDHSAAYARSLAVRALLEMKAGDLEAAERFFDRAHEYGLRGAYFENDRGRLSLEQGRFDDAIAHFREALERQPTLVEARSNLAVAYRRAGRLDRAVQVLQELLAERPDYGPAHFNLAEILRQQMAEVPEARQRALTQQALLHYTQALEAGYDPDTVIERRAGLAMLGEDLEQAEEDLLEMTRDPSIGGRVLYLLGRVKKDQGRLDIALNLMKMAGERGYADPLLDADLGEIYFRRGELEAARDAFTKACRARPDLVVTRANLSLVLAELGAVDAADSVLREAEALEPDHPLVRQRRAYLDALRGPE